MSNPFTTSRTTYGLYGVYVFAFWAGLLYIAWEGIGHAKTFTLIWVAAMLAPGLYARLIGKPIVFR